jgi:hypothetical protein
MLRFFLVSIFFIFSSTGSSQSKWSYGLNLCPDVVSIPAHRNYSYGITDSNPLTIKYTIGGNLSYNFNERFGILSGLWFSKSGFTRTTTADGIHSYISDPNGNYTLSMKSIVKFSYLELPLLFKYTFNPQRKISLYSSSGFIFSYLIYYHQNRMYGSGYTSNDDLIKYQSTYSFIKNWGIGFSSKVNTKTLIIIEPNISMGSHFFQDYALSLRASIYRSF